jgi:hypothetical protein
MHGMRDWQKDLLANKTTVIVCYVIGGTVGVSIGAVHDAVQKQSVAWAGVAVYSIMSLVVGGAWFVIATRTSLMDRYRGVSWLLNILFTSTGFLYSLGVRQGWISDEQLADTLSQFLRSIGAVGRLCAALALGGIGYALYQLRARQLHVYARAEISFALVSCYVAINKMREGVSLSNISVAVGSTYLIVRGLENRQKAIDAERERDKLQKVRDGLSAHVSYESS